MTGPSALLTCCLDSKGFVTGGSIASFVFVLVCCPVKSAGTDSNQITMKCDFYRGRILPLFRRNIMSPSSESKCKKQRFCFDASCYLLTSNLNLKKEAVFSFEIAVEFYRTTQRHGPKMVHYVMFITSLLLLWLLLVYACTSLRDNIYDTLHQTISEH